MIYMCVHLKLRAMNYSTDLTSMKSIEDMCVKYIYSDAVLFLKKNNNFYAANSAMLDVKFTSSLMERNNGKSLLLHSSFSSDYRTRRFIGEELILMIGDFSENSPILKSPI